jgi:hypothetical protein
VEPGACSDLEGGKEDERCCWVKVEAGSQLGIFKYTYLDAVYHQMRLKRGNLPRYYAIHWQDHHPPDEAGKIPLMIRFAWRIFLYEDVLKEENECF